MSSLCCPCEPNLMKTRARIISFITITFQISMHLEPWNQMETRENRLHGKLDFLLSYICPLHMQFEELI